MTDAPSPFRLEQAMSALLSARARLLAEDPDIQDDERLYSDMLQGESEGDPFDVLDRVIRAAIHPGSMADAAKRRADEIAGRAARYARRRDNLRAAAFAALDALGIRKHERPDFVASVRAGTASVQITDETKLAQEYVRWSMTPDKAAILAALKTGAEVPGAELSNAIPSLALKAT